MLPGEMKKYTTYY